MRVNTFNEFLELTDVGFNHRWVSIVHLPEFIRLMCFFHFQLEKNEAGFIYPQGGNIRDSLSRVQPSQEIGAFLKVPGSIVGKIDYEACIPETEGKGSVNL